jgi:diacylglycerol O-acyltransferase / wax synthase
VHSYAGLLEFGLTACRRVLSQDESCELIEHLQRALREIEALPTVAESPVTELNVAVLTGSSKASSWKKPAADARPDASSQAG